MFLNKDKMTQLWFECGKIRVALSDPDHLHFLSAPLSTTIPASIIMTTRSPEVSDVIPMQGVEETDVQWITPVATPTSTATTTTESQVRIGCCSGLVFYTEKCK